jgi:hypothetical protein
MRRLLIALVLLALCASPALASPTPAGSNLDKVLVIGVDGTRWDLLRAAMRSGRAPNLARIARAGFARPAPLRYDPDVYVLSEVGWSSIASGVWPDKHGVDGHMFNTDPGQATKNGYLDFITRIEAAAPSLNTYLASDWVNIGTTEDGGPIFGDAMDARFNVAIPEEKLELWDAGDVQVTHRAARHLGRANPDASFVYLGVIDETAHLVGSATPAYAQAIATTDRRIGRLLRAVRSRPSYPFESWTVLVTTDHGQKALTEPSILTHFTQTPLEITSFVLGSGPGLGSRVKKPLVVDVAPTTLQQLGLRVRPAWNLDGRPLSRSRGRSSAVVRLRGSGAARRLDASIRLTSAPRGVRSVVLRLPAGVKVNGPVRALVNGRPVAARASGRTIVARFSPRALRKLSLVASGASGKSGGQATLTLRGRKASRGTLRLRLAG